MPRARMQTFEMGVRNFSYAEKVGWGWGGGGGGGENAKKMPILGAKIRGVRCVLVKKNCKFWSNLKIWSNLPLHHPLSHPEPLSPPCVF